MRNRIGDMRAPLTTAGLRRRVRPYKRALIAWFDLPRHRVSRALARAGFRSLPYRDTGCERTVLLGPGIVVKTRDPGLGYRRPSKFLAPQIEIAPGIVVQPLGRPMNKVRRRTWKMWEQMNRIETALYSRGVYDTHHGNLALFADGTIRCIDY